MPFNKYVPNPVQAMKYKAGDAAQAAELQKLVGVTFQPDSQQMTDAQGNTYGVADGDYVGIDTNGTLRAYDSSYFESRYTQLNNTAVKS